MVASPQGHGRSLAIAERAAENVLGVGTLDRAAEWALVVDEIKAIQKTAA
jgi:hypothetical protein